MFHADTPLSHHHPSEAHHTLPTAVLPQFWCTIPWVCIQKGEQTELKIADNIFRQYAPEQYQQASLARGLGFLACMPAPAMLKPEPQAILQSDGHVAWSAVVGRPVAAGCGHQPFVSWFATRPCSRQLASAANSVRILLMTVLLNILRLCDPAGRKACE